MSTATPDRKTPPASLPLVEGQRLDQPTFHARYEAMPPGTRAELIEGVVSMPSPVGYDHGDSLVPVVVWMSYYAEATLGVQCLPGVTTIIDWRNEPQPDALLRVRPGHGGRTRDEGRFVAGVPELVVEVSRSTRYLDLGPKLNQYERAGVLEYVVRAVDPDDVVWHVLEDGRFVVISPDADGLYRSRAFPGLWLDRVALLAGDTRGLREALDRGLATPDHAAFVARLAEAKRGPGPEPPRP